MRSLSRQLKAGDTTSTSRGSKSERPVGVCDSYGRPAHSEDAAFNAAGLVKVA